MADVARGGLFLGILRESLANNPPQVKKTHRKCDENENPFSRGAEF
jgi:hypothetical protein